MANIEADDDEMGVIMLVQQYSARFGITFSSHLMDNPARRAKLMKLMSEAISGKRGAFTDADILGDDDLVD
jgi:hypothetical protein